MDNINLNYLKVFLEVAKSKSFLEASNKLFISQPAVSRSIANLEEELNVKLFFRENKGVILTASGEVLFEYLNQMKNLLDSCGRVLISMNDIEEGTIVIGVQSHIVRNYLMNKIVDFQKKHPKIKIQLIDASTSSLLEQLESRKIDFIIDSSPIQTKYNNLEIKKIKRLNTCFIKSADNKNTFKKLKDVVKQDLILPGSRGSIRRNLNKIFDKNNIEVEPKLDFETEELIIEAVRRNLGIGYVVEDAIDYLIEARIIEKIEIEEELPYFEINIVSVESYLSNIAKIFIEEEIKDEI
ncbi:MAG: LysR family transcriptional regulator [Bacilli bacterium]|nr:LysR family transcriptional regulator [Bacilli bacterium]